MKQLGLLAISVGAAVIGMTVPVSLHWSSAKIPVFSLDTAQAVIGRPGTPRSVAGVARRTERRAYRRGYYGAAAAGAVAAGAYAASYGAYGPGPSESYGYGGGGGYGDGGAGGAPGTVTVVNPATGRWCSMEPSGYRWCWTP